MKIGVTAMPHEQVSDFPLFSQKSAGESRPQVMPEKRFATVSTDSQESSQQQGFIFIFQGSFFVEGFVVVDF